MKPKAPARQGLKPPPSGGGAVTFALSRYLSGAYDVRARIFVRRPRHRVIPVLVPRRRSSAQIWIAA
jgi:hypothetical protein